MTRREIAARLSAVRRTGAVAPIVQRAPVRFGIPPKGWSQAEAFRRAYATLREALEGSRLHLAFTKRQEVADYLNGLKWRPGQPITAATIRRWEKHRHFPRMSGSKFYTTNLHVLAFLHTFRDYKPESAWEPPATPEEAEL